MAAVASPDAEYLRRWQDRIENTVPVWRRGRGLGWLTAEYAMLPGSTAPRKQREASRGKRDGRSVEIVDLRTLVPLDERTILESVKKTGRVVVVYEAPKTGGFGGELSAIIAEMMGKVDDEFSRFDSETLKLMRSKLPANIRGFIPGRPSVPEEK